MAWRITSLLLNLAHALDHLMLLVFATAVAAIAREFGVGRWEDLMPYTTGAFVMFGVGSFPSGRTNLHTADYSSAFPSGRLFWSMSWIVANRLSGCSVCPHCR